MSIEGISISFAEVTNTASTITTLNGNLTTKLEDIKKEMNSLTNSWESDASRTIQEKFNALAAKFVDYKKIIDEYSKFLNTTVSNYDSAETTINNNASQFK
ncbi:pore-forming ESAT-6 family protein [Paenibacillus sp. N1-5-1-14]|uniref:pore-forming ESAT-6 family protein n=1 Tax=Paenibacillus radicibacter TaxID=2972488 RepID=UPI002159A236|nr:pore-forming ESAT-6 family protein [Paenibacillus radicibacter]MCR8643646.1 pore-forming ESAT-6 family protein [Paenibacillus radicibacter]MCR8644754.1 pore-forming ESAT-6 family protein [Paenibacillus radicibacter]